MRFLNIDWKGIRTLHGSQQNGFEELCSQIARLEIPPGSSFVRNGTPDGGVECYTTLADGSEWGWQAKYFDTLGDSQWSQLDESVQTALNKHPQLSRYFICIPLDLPDARVDRKQSARQRWDKHVEKWGGWAIKRRMDVEFVYWGSSELLTLLTEPKHVGRVRFWFDVRIFDEAWFNARLDEAVKAAGPRYTPEIHVYIPIAADFEAFGRTATFFDELKAHARGIRDKLRSFRHTDSENTVEIPETSSLISQVTLLTEQILTDLSGINVQPVGELPFQRISSQVTTTNTAAEKLEKAFYECEKEYNTKQDNQEDGKRRSTYSINPYQDRQRRLLALQSELRDLNESLDNAERLSSNSLLVLTGKAGTGKTHLLCDIACKRIKEGYPTVLLMGQRFVNENEPWTQTLQQLDLSSLSAEEFVGALEAAAQAAGCRALLLIDALNEGSGRRIWPSHLAAFLARLECSPWIGIALSVRSSYEQLIVPKEVFERAARVKHHGFEDYEYEATRTFFAHYGLELPSTPLLAPEFHNPLFLKTLCRGLKESGKRRLPRGFHGITATFELFLGAVNNKLAPEISFNSRIPLVRQALDAFVRALIDTGESCLPLVKAEKIINELLPGRDFDHSLYHGLVSEGVLLEEVAWLQDTHPEYVVLIAYERFADHLVASSLLDAHMDAQSPEAAFIEGAPLGFLCDPQQRITSGLLEAFCIQVPELTGKELTEIAPEVEGRWDISEAFRQSLIWRDPQAFSNSTLDSLNKLIRTDYDFSETLNVLLTTTTLPEHPLNAIFLDSWLRAKQMPDRDALWSTYLHKAWKTHGVVDRLIDWASTVTQKDALDDETIDLCSTALAWMLTTSNRSLRDNATKALVSLLTGRLDAAVRFVERFVDVDDLYVTERIYAVAYGVAMRSHDSEKVGSLARCVYSRVFATGTPPIHILLRDYARGVVERALYLGANIDVNEDNIHPPYQSSWPTIPTEEDIKPLLPNLSRGSHDSGNLEWARNRIGASVMSDDFARYVIGTNTGSTDFLSLKLEEPAWQSPDSLLKTLVSELSEEEMIAWIAFDDANKELKKMNWSFIQKQFTKQLEDGNHSKTDDITDIITPAQDLEQPNQPEIVALEKEQESAFETLKRSLTKEHSLQFDKILELKKNRKQRPPRFDLSLIQRYILWRVFDLGWTIECFGHFDRFTIGYHGRDSSKAERIGKKYQWIAYHEIMALVSDHFQYCDEYREDDSGNNYGGPWQINLRDIDPSCTLIDTRKRIPWSGHSLSWWGSIKYENWNAPQDQLEWAKRYDDLPHIEDLLSVVCPKDGSGWLNLCGFFNWKQPPPVDKDPTDIERRDLWYRCNCYLIRDSDVKTFMKWAEDVDFSGRMMPQPPRIDEVFLGEYGWSPAWHDFYKEHFGDDEWIFLGKDCPVKVREIISEYHHKSSEFDCSADDNCTLTIPSNDIVTGLGLRWSGYGSDFVDEAGQIIAFDPTAYAEGPSALLLRQDKLKEFLEHEKLALCWIVTGEKFVHDMGGFTSRNFAALRLSGAYVLDSEGLTGFLKCFFETRIGDDGEISIVPLATLR